MIFVNPGTDPENDSGSNRYKRSQRGEHETDGCHEELTVSSSSDQQNHPLITIEPRTYGVRTDKDGKPSISNNSRQS